MPKLTAKSLTSLKPGTKTLDTGHRAADIHCQLWFDVGKRRRSWRLYYSVGGSRTNRVFGHFLGDDAEGSVTLADARRFAADAAQLIRRGVDPFGPKPDSLSNTVRECFDAYVGHISESVDGAPRLLSWRQRAKLMEVHAVRAWGDRHVLEIDRETALDLLTAIAAPTVAHQVRSHLASMWTWLIETRLERKLVSNPFRDLRVGRGGSTRTEWIPPPQLAEVWTALDDEVDRGVADGDADGAIRALAVQAAILTGHRRNEILLSRWHEIHDVDVGRVDDPMLRRFFERRSIRASDVAGTWLMIPGRRRDANGRVIGTTKGRSRDRGQQPKDAYLGTPLGSRWLARLRTAHEVAGYDVDWMFPGPNRRPRKDFDGKVWTAYQAASGCTRLRWHILRHSVSTLLYTLGYLEEEVGLILGHTRKASDRNTTLGYIHPDRYLLMARLAPIYADWHDYLAEIFRIDDDL